MIGKTLAHYQISELLGKGGMGEVYRAHDGKLGRDVALKILPRELSGDPERAARFEREARTLASLQHPHIASIYGFEEAEGSRFLTMELVEGEDLSQQISRGPIPTDEALSIAKQIAAGLEAAHEKNIVHRDLKPANIKLAADGSVKILDFGLARAYAGDAAEGDNPDTSPTITAAMTGAGVILGTAAYMSPEQARGRAADKRADIWAFGVVLFEMITGQRLFSGETISDTLASVLKTEVDWSRLPKELPPRIRTLLTRCLERAHDRRLRDMGEARILLEDELSGAPDTHLEGALRSGVIPAPTISETQSANRGRWLQLAAAALIGAVLTFAAARSFLSAPDAEVPLRKWALDAADREETFEHGVISPDGRSVALVTPSHIVVSDLSAREAREFPVQDFVEDLFWSPDSRSLAYVVRNHLIRLDPISGQQQNICDAPDGFTGGSGGAWSDDGTIVLSEGEASGLFQVSERGGDPRPILPVDKTKENDFHDPSVLPGARGVLFVPHGSNGSFASIDLWTGTERKTVVTLDKQVLSSPIYSATGHILFRRNPTNPGIWAVPFSLDRLEATGEPFLVAPDGDAPSVSNDGTLVYRSSSGTSTLRLSWNDSGGNELFDAGELALERPYLFPALAPSGQLACATVDDGENPDLWIFDAVRGTSTRLTFGEGREEWPAWAPSGNSVTYHVRPEGASGIDSLRVLRIAADGTGQPDTLAVGFISAVSPDGEFVTFTSLFEPGGLAQGDLAYRPWDGDRSQTQRLVSAAGLQMDGRVAPGGKYIAYVSNESGEYEIYLTRFPSGEGRWQVSIGGGYWPRWNEAGDRLFYARDNDIMSVDVSLGATPTLGRPQLTTQRPALGKPTVGGWAPSFGVSGDGEQFLYFRNPKGMMAEVELMVVQNWIAEFEGEE